METIIKKDQAGVPPGGTTGQALTKISGTDYDYDWVDVPTGPNVPGDVTAGPGSGAQAASLAAVGTAQTVGDATHYPVVTTDAKGRVTGMSSQAVPSGALTSAGGTITGTRS